VHRASVLATNRHSVITGINNLNLIFFTDHRYICYTGSILIAFLLFTSGY
jgi:hypothetical protein